MIKYAQQNGNWSDDIADTTWYDAASGGSAVNHPVEGDNAIINAGVTITIDDSAAATIIVGDDTGNAIDVKGILQYLHTAGVDHILQCKGHLNISSGGSLKIGTAANPIPAARKFEIKLNYSASLAEGKWGLINNGEMILQGKSKTVKTLLTANLSAAGTVLTVGDTTDWEVGDRLAVASTSRTYSEAEDKIIQTVDSATQVTMTAGAINAHSGTSPTQAEVINLTRNVKVTSYNTSYRGYVYCVSGSNQDVDYVEFYMIGYNATYKHGIEIRTTVVGDTNFAYCSVWGNAASNYPFYLYNTQNAVIDNCVIYDVDEQFYVYNSYNNTFSNCVIMKISDKGFEMKNRVDNTITGCTVTSCSSNGFDINHQLTILIDFSDNVAHSNASVGFNLYVSNTTLANLTSYRNGSSGLAISSSSSGLDINDMTAFGNNYQNILLYGFTVIFNNLTLDSDLSHSTLYGISVANSAIIKIIDSDLGTSVAHSTADIRFVPNNFSTVEIINTNLSSPTKVYDIHNASAGSFVQCEDLGQVAYADKAWYKNGIVVRDNAIYKSGSYSMRFDYQYNNAAWLEYDIYIPVKNGEQVVVSAWLRKNASYADANRPKIVLSGQGITEDEAQMTDVTDTWERVTVQGTPTRTGLAKLTIKTYLVNSGAKAWADFVKTDILSGVLNTIEGEFWANGHIAEVFMDTGSITAAEFWKTLEADIDVAGSFGNKIKATNKIVGWLRSLL